MNNVTDFLLILNWQRICDKNVRPNIIVAITPNLAESIADPKDEPMLIYLYQDVAATKLVLNESSELQDNQKCYYRGCGHYGTLERVYGPYVTP